MVSDRIECALKRIIKETEKSCINWRPFSEFWNANIKNENLADFICTYHNEFIEIVFSESFFAQKDGMMIFLLTSECESARDGSILKRKEIMISTSIYGEILNVPDFAISYKNDLFENVKEYWDSKSGDYNREISDILTVLDTFSGDSCFEDN